MDPKAVVCKPKTKDCPEPWALTSISEALKYYSEVFWRPSNSDKYIRIEDEVARRDFGLESLITKLSGHKAKKTAHNKHFKEEDKIGHHLKIRGCGVYDAYETKALKLTALRRAVDASRMSSTENILPWSENDQRALEYQRHQEDHLHFVGSLRVFMADDTDLETQNPDSLLYRLRNIQRLIEQYDLQCYESSNRLWNYECQTKQRTQDPAGFEAPHDPQMQGTLDDQTDESSGTSPTNHFLKLL